MANKKIVQELEYAASLDKEHRGDGIVRWAVNRNDEELKELPVNEQHKLRELLYRSISFLKQESESIKKNLIDLEKIKKFL